MPSLWPPLAVVRDTVLLLVALLVVALLADGDLVLVLSLVLIVAWLFLSVRGPENEALASVPWLVRLLPIFAAIVIADLIVDGHWWPFTLVAITLLLVTLARAATVLWLRRQHAAV